MKKQELIEMLREYISAAKNPTSSVHLVVLSLPEATDLLRELEGDWISVDDRLPEESGEYLVYRNGPASQSVQYYDCSDKTWGYLSSMVIKINYWMPLPQPPKTEI